MNRDRLLIPLTLAAGCVDAVGFLSAHVFPANMTGNTVLLALGLARLNVERAWLAALVLGAFCLGVALGTIFLRKSSGGWSPRVHWILAAGGCVLFAGACGAAFGLSAQWLALIVAAAMGLQATAVAQVGVSGVSTVVVTSTVTTVIRSWIGGGRSHPPRPAGLPGWIWLAYFIGALGGGLLLHFTTPAISLLFSAIAVLGAVAAWNILSGRRQPSAE